MNINKYKIKNIILLLLITLFIPTIIVAQNIDDPYKNIKYFELNNGLKIYMLSDKLATNTQIDLEVKVGMDVENEKNAGISHLVEHIIFRDQRVPHKDYLDYIKEEGATDVNGYTSRYETHYVATIDSNQSYWLIETFAQMLLDKDVSVEDLEIEKKALQVEIGELQWYNKPVYLVGKAFEQFGKLFPDDEKIYIDEFSLKKRDEQPASYFYKKNNYTFTLDEVMKHYDDYYYPENMTIKIAGNFDDKKMKTLIEKKFGNCKKVGDKKATKPPYNAKLNNKPHATYITGEEESYAYIGTKYILDDYKKYLIVDAYTDYLATNMQQLLRNKLGQTYSVSPFYNSNRDAVITGVSFGSLHVEFQNNINLVKQKIKQDTINMDDSEIKEALEQSVLYYTSLEHDSDTLLNLIDAQEYIQIYHAIFDETPYSIFHSISSKEFQTTISTTYAQEHSYMYIYNDYYIFPFDISILGLLMLLVLILVYIKAYKIIYANKGFMVYNARDILLTRRLGNRFLLVLKFILIFTIATFISSWSEYWLFKIFLRNPHYETSIEFPYDYLYHVASFTYFIIIFMSILSLIFNKSFSRLDVTKNGFYFMGSSAAFLDKAEIIDIDVIPWSLGKFKDTYGLALLFYKPLVMISLKNGSVVYLRSNNAQHLKEDLSSQIEV